MEHVKAILVITVERAVAPIYAPGRAGATLVRNDQVKDAAHVIDIFPSPGAGPTTFTALFCVFTVRFLTLVSAVLPPLTSVPLSYYRRPPRSSFSYRRLKGLQQRMPLIFLTLVSNLFYNLSRHSFHHLPSPD